MAVLGSLDMLASALVMVLPFQNRNQLDLMFDKTAKMGFCYRQQMESPLYPFLRPRIDRIDNNSDPFIILRTERTVKKHS